MGKLPFRIIIITLLLCMVYAIARFHIFKGVEWYHFPLFINNKVFAFAGLICFLLSFSAKAYIKDQQALIDIKKYLGRTGIVLIIIHVIISLLLFRPEVYDKFFGPDGNLNGTGEWSMLLGTLGLISLIMINNSYNNPESGNLFQVMIRSTTFYICMLLFSVLHAVVLGFEGWLTPGEWPGGMPSFSLLSLLAFLVSLILVLIQDKRQTGMNV